MIASRSRNLPETEQADDVTRKREAKTAGQGTKSGARGKRGTVNQRRSSEKVQARVGNSRGERGAA